MLRKLNVTLGIIAICGALLFGGLKIYQSRVDIAESDFVQQLGGQ